ncbi:MAG: hypothetical protein LJE68_08280 [Rhodobacter sp.]|jgi:hypothetical protein|nr:hypothetical protein [Rhodobacter sp.]
MTTQMLVSNPLTRLAPLLAAIFRSRTIDPVPDAADTGPQADHGLIDEAIWNDREVFASGLDVEYFMHMYGRR